jgi:hypothetical protein
MIRSNNNPGFGLMVGYPDVAIVDSCHPYGALALMTPHAIRAPELPAGSVL